MADVRPAAVVCSDIHLSHRPPIARSAEPDWYAAMRRPIKQVRKLTQRYKVPLIIAGDIFDKPGNPPKWGAPPELLDFAVREFGLFEHGVYAIPGQHDLPEHSQAKIKQSAYWLLCRYGSVVNLDPAKRAEIVPPGYLELHPFPWGYDIKPPEKSGSGWRRVAVVHAYVWIKGRKHPAAPTSQWMGRLAKKLRGYDAAIFGDNHMSFKQTYRKYTDTPLTVFNCGTLMRRTIREKDYQPCVGLLYSDGTLTRRKLDCSLDKFVFDKEKLEMDEPDVLAFKRFAEELESLGVESLDFAETVERWIEKHKNKLDKRTREVLVESLSGKEQ